MGGRALPPGRSRRRRKEDARARGQPPSRSTRDYLYKINRDSSPQDPLWSSQASPHRQPSALHQICTTSARRSTNDGRPSANVSLKSSVGTPTYQHEDCGALRAARNGGTHVYARGMPASEPGPGTLPYLPPDLRWCLGLRPAPRSRRLPGPGDPGNGGAGPDLANPAAGEPARSLGRLHKGRIVRYAGSRHEVETRPAHLKP